MDKADYKAELHTQFDVAENVRWTHKASGEEVTLGVGSLAWTNDLDQLQPIADPQNVNAVLGTGGDDGLAMWTGAYGTDLNFEWRTHATKLLKFLRIENAGALPAVTLPDLNGVAPPPHVPFNISHGPAVWLPGF